MVKFSIMTKDILGTLVFAPIAVLICMEAKAKKATL